MKLVTVCVGGAPARSPKENRRRIAALGSALSQIDARWSNIDAIVFPGGYFALEGDAPCLHTNDRLPTLHQHTLIHTLHDARRLLTQSRGAWLITGIDSRTTPQRASDQLCVAYGPRKRIRIARKIFPTRGEPKYVCNAADYDATARIIELACGKRAILAACYDMFGLADGESGSGVRQRGIKRTILDGYSDWSLPSVTDRQHLIETFAAEVRRAKVRVGIAAIHRFPSRSHMAPHAGVTLWQRHGIAGCAATLKGMAIGAAHFAAQLPRSPTRSCLAARGVPDRHLHMPDRTRREAWSWKPADHFLCENVLVRLFE